MDNNNDKDDEYLYEKGFNFSVLLNKNREMQKEKLTDIKHLASGPYKSGRIAGIKYCQFKEFIQRGPDEN